MAGTDFTTTITGNVTGFDVGPINNLSNALKTVPSAAQSASSSTGQLGTTFQQTSSGGTQLNSSLNQVTSSSNQTTGSVRGLTSGMSPLSGILANTTNNTRGLTGAFAGAGTSATQFHGSTAPLPGALNQVATGGLNVTNMLQPLNSNLQATSQTQKATQETTIGLGEKIALMGGFITTTIGHVFGLIEGMTGLEAAQVTADRAQQRVNTSLLTAEKAQDNYNKMVNKFGPDSRQAQEALANLNNKQEANRIATEKSEIAQKKLQEAYVSFALEVVNTIGELATMGSTVSILATKIGIKTAATVVDTEANIAAGTSAAGAAAALEAEGVAAGNAGKGMDGLGFATLGVGTKFAIIAAPIAAAIALFALIETNTFGIGDAFRSILPPIGSAIDAIINGLATVRNSFVGLANGIETFKAIVTNIFIDIYNSVASAFNSMILAGRAFAIQLQSAVATVQKFFIDNLINPIIRAWNDFNLGMQQAWNDTVNKLADFFKPVVSTIIAGIATLIKGMAALPLGLGDAFKKPAEDIAKFEEQLKKTGTTAGKTGEDIANGFKRVPLVTAEGTKELSKFNTDGLLPIINTYANVNAASHTYDSELIKVNSTIGQSIVQSVSFYSHQDNLGKLLGATVVPAFQGVVKQAQEWTGGLIASIIPTQKASGETEKLSGTLAKAQKAQKDYSTTLTESIAKQDQQSAAMLKSISTGQQYQKLISDLGKTLAEATVKTADLTAKLTDATAIQLRHSIAVQEGINKALEFGVKLQDDATTMATYNAALEQATGFTQKFGGIIPATTANLELLAKAMAGDGEAAQKLMSDFIDATRGMTEAGKKLIDDMSKVFDNLGKSFKENKAIKEIPKDLRKIMSPEAIDFAVLQAEWSASIDKMTTGMSLEFSASGGKFNESGIAAVKRFVEAFADQKAIQGSPEIKSFFQSFDAVLTQAQQQGGAAGHATIVAFLAKMEAAGGGAGAAAQKIAQIMGIGPEVATIAARQGTAAGGAFVGTLTSRFSNVPGVIQKTIIDPMTGLPTTAQALATKVGNAFISIGTALEALPTTMLRIFTGAFVTSLLPPLAQMETSISAAFVSIIAALEQVAAGFNLAFTKGAQDAAGQVNLLTATVGADFQLIVAALALVVQGFTVAFNTATKNAGTVMNGLTVNVQGNVTAMIAAVNTFATAVTTAFNTATRNAGTVMNGLTVNINGNTANMIKAFNAAATALTNDFNTGTRNAGTAMNSLATNVNTNTNNMISRLNGVTSAFNNIRGSINNAISAVNSLISRINAIPTSKTVTITINEIHNVTQIVHRVVLPFSTAATTTTSLTPTISTEGATTTTTTLAPSGGSGGKTKVIRLEISEPTVVKINDRELIKQINKKILELDIGALV